MAPSPIPTYRVSDRPNDWPTGAPEAAVELQRLLSIGDRQWHALKHQRSRRGAEQLASALVMLLQSDEPARLKPTAARQQAVELLEHALGWLKGEVSDPGCPSHH